MLHVYLDMVLVRYIDSSPLSWAVLNIFIYQVYALMFDLEDPVILRKKEAAYRLVY